MASNSKKKPATTSSPGDDARRWREGAAAPRDAEIAPYERRGKYIDLVLAAVDLDVRGVFYQFEDRSESSGDVRVGDKRKARRDDRRGPQRQIKTSSFGEQVVERRADVGVVGRQHAKVVGDGRGMPSPRSVHWQAWQQG